MPTKRKGQTKKELYDQAKKVKNSVMGPCKPSPSLSQMNKSQLKRYIFKYKI